MVYPAMIRSHVFCVGASVLGLLLVILSGGAWADAISKAGATVQEGELNSIDMQLFRQFTVMEYTPGQPFEVTITMSASTTEGLTAIGLYETMPPGWVFNGMRGLTGDPPTVSPQPGDMGVLEFAWIQIPELPYTFAYIVTPPETGGGAVFISGQIEYRTTGGAQKSPPVISNLNGQDRIAPTITVLGANPLEVTQNTAFADPGATANDNVDGDISSRVQVIGNVDTSTLGMYTLTYRVSDQAGNQAEATRTVRVVSASTGTGGVYTGGGTSSTGRTGGTSRSSAGTSSAAAASKQNTQKPANVNVNVTPDTTATARLAEMMAKREETQNKLKEAQKHVATPAKNEGGKPPAKKPGDATGTPAASTEGQAEETTDATTAKPAEPPKEEETAAPVAEENTAPVASKPPKVSTTPPSPGIFAVLKERFAQMTPSQLASLMVGLAVALALLAFTLLAWKIAYSPPVRRRPSIENPVEEEK